MRYQDTPNRMAKITNTHHTKCCKRCRKLGVVLQNGPATLKTTLAVGHIISVWPSNPSLGDLTSSNENICPHKNLSMNAYSNSIHDHPKLATIQMFFNRWMNKLWCIHRMAYDSAAKSNKPVTSNSFHESHRCYAKWKKPGSKVYHISPCRTMIQQDGEPLIAGWEGVEGGSDYKATS